MKDGRKEAWKIGGNGSGIEGRVGEKEGKKEGMKRMTKEGIKGESGRKKAGKV